MNNLRKAAQAVLALSEKHPILRADLETLRQALAEPVMCIECNGKGHDPVPRPVCCQQPDADGGCCGSPEPEWFPCENCEGVGFVKPPSIDALIAELADLKECHKDLLDSDNANMQKMIAEIEAVVTCAETALDFDTGETNYIGEAYPKGDVLAILDKYRSK